MRVVNLTEAEAGLLEQLADQVIASTAGTAHPWHKLAVSARKALQQNRPRTADEQAAGINELGADALAREKES